MIKYKLHTHIYTIYIYILKYIIKYINYIYIIIIKYINYKNIYKIQVETLHGDTDKTRSQNAFCKFHKITNMRLSI